MKYIKIFENFTESNNQENPPQSHLDFLNSLISNLTKIRDDANENGWMSKEDQNWIEELYSLHKNSFKEN